MKKPTYEQFRKVLDKAYYDGYSAEKYPQNSDIDDYLNRCDDLTYGTNMPNCPSHLTIWFTDLYSDNPADEIKFDCETNEFIPVDLDIDYIGIDNISSISGEELKKYRQNAGLKQTEVTEILNIPLRTYQSWEYDERHPDKFTLRAVFHCIDDNSKN